jgi:hypothetical protein
MSLFTSFLRIARPYEPNHAGPGNLDVIRKCAAVLNTLEIIQRQTKRRENLYALPEAELRNCA